MIIKVERGESGEGLLEYQRRLKGTAEEQAGVHFFAKNGIHSVENAAAVLDRLATRSGRKNAIIHIILRDERGLSEAEWQIAMMAALKEAGVAAHAWIAFLHDHDGDTPGDHMHIAAVAVDRDGNPPPRFLRSETLDRRVTREEAAALPRGDVHSRTWDSQLQRRMMSVARRLEDELGLRPLARDRAAQNEPVRTQAKSSQGARDRERRTGIPPLADLLDTTATQTALEETSYDARVAALAMLDLGLRPYTRSNGQLAGLQLYRLCDPRLHCPVSALGSRYGMRAMDKRSAVPFAQWQQDRTQTAPDLPAPTTAKSKTLWARYEDEMRQVAAQQRLIRDERIAVTAWGKRQRAEALARKKAVGLVAGTNRARVHRAAAMASYRQQCTQIDREVAAQRAALEARWPRRLPFVDWLAVQASTDPVAARKYADLQTRSAATAATVAALSTAPTREDPAVLAPSPSPAHIAAMVAEQERLMRMSQALEAEASILQRGSAVDALAARLETVGVKLIIDADRQNRRVRIEPEAVRIDGARLMSVHPAALPLPVLEKATETQARQVAEERTLAIAIRCAAGLPPRSAEMPASWLQRICGNSIPTRWLTTEQEADIRRAWEPLTDGLPPKHPAIAHVSPERVEVGFLTSTSVTHSTEPLDIPATMTSPTERLPATPAELPNAPPAPPREPPQATPHAHVHEAMAMMKRPFLPVSPAVPASDARETIAPRQAAPAPLAAAISAADPALHQLETGEALPQPLATGKTLSPATKVPSPTLTELPGPVTMSRPVEPWPPASDDINVVAQWLSASHAARTNQDRQQDSEALAARLMASDALGLLDPDLQRLAERQAAAYQQRQGSRGLQAIERQSADGPTAVTTAPPPQSPPGNVAEDESVKRVAPQSTMPLRIPSGIADGWQR